MNPVIGLDISKRSSVRKMQIYNAKKISILKSLISQFNAGKLGFFHYSTKELYLGIIKIRKHRTIIPL